MTKTAAVLGAILGLGFGLPCAYGAWYLARRGEVWTFLGFPTYGGGPFERAGMATTVPLLVGFLVVCILEVVSAWFLWRGDAIGGYLTLALLPFEIAFWIGFALPFGPVLGVPRALFVLAAWSSLTR